MSNKIKITFFGTPDFAVPTLKALINADFCDVVQVVTQPDKAIGRHHSKLIASPVKKVAQDFNISIKHKILAPNTNLGILVAYGKIIPKKIINSFPLGILNLHPSLLPKYRGSSPIQSAILNQDKETGVTIIKLDDQMDHGPILFKKKITLDQTETAGELSDKLAQIGSDLLVKILPDYITGQIKPKKQNHNKATFTKKLAKKDGKINNQTYKTFKLEAFVRAMNPWPGAWTIWKEKKLIIWSIDKNGQPLEVQLQGKKKMPYSEFLKGHQFSTNKQFKN